jgi:hypothetical protein
MDFPMLPSWVFLRGPNCGGKSGNGVSYVIGLAELCPSWKDFFTQIKITLWLV